MTATEKNINTLTNWIMGLHISFLIFRVTIDLLGAMNDPETGLKDALRKCKKRVTAAVISVTIESTVLFIQNFYK